jgi:hypothetical protein
LFILLLFLSNPAPKSSRKPTSGHCISRTELHFWCKYRYNSEILQTKSNIFLKKSQKLAILSDFFTKISDFGAKSSLFIGVCTLFNYHCFCFVALSGPPIPYLYIIYYWLFNLFRMQSYYYFWKKQVFLRFFIRNQPTWGFWGTE